MRVKIPCGVDEGDVAVAVVAATRQKPKHRQVKSRVAGVELMKAKKWPAATTSGQSQRVLRLTKLNPVRGESMASSNLTWIPTPKNCQVTVNHCDVQAAGDVAEEAAVVNKRTQLSPQPGSDPRHDLGGRRPPV